jgi:antitoxin HicB
MRSFPARFRKEPEGGFTVTFRDVPEAITFGATPEEAASMAVDALETALSFYLEGRMAAPRPSPLRRGERAVSLTPLGEAKLALYEAMREQKIGKAELARRLRCHLPQVDRLLDLCHQSRWKSVERALAAVGKRVVVEVRDAA